MQKKEYRVSKPQPLGNYLPHTGMSAYELQFLHANTNVLFSTKQNFVIEPKIDLIRCIISSSHMSDKEQKRHKLVFFF